jgi:ABC-2 type transport system permease protein
MNRMTILPATLRCEWRILRRDPALWLTLAILLACIAYALHNGLGALENRAHAVAEAKADETRRLTELRQAVVRIESGAIPAPDRPYRDPRNALAVGNNLGANMAVLPPAPLAVIAIGLSDLHPPALRVGAGSKDGFLFADEIANPGHLLAGSFDLAFVLVFVFPLCLLALTYNLVSGEREQGTLALTAACPVSMPAVLAGKLLVRGGVPLAVTLCAVNASLAVVTAWPPEAMFWLSVSIMLYGLFWVALAAFVNALARDSAFNALALIAAWVFFLLLVPALVNGVAVSLHPPPARAEMVLAVRSASVDINRERDAQAARYRDEHPGADDAALRRGSERERAQRRVAVQIAAAERADAVLAQHDAKLLRQHRLADRLSLASPALLLNEVLVELAGSGQGRHTAFLAQVDVFHLAWRQFFVSRAQDARLLSATDYDAFPRFVFSEVLPSGFSGRLLLGQLAVGVMALMLFALAARRVVR